MKLAEIIARLQEINARMAAIHTECRAEGISAEALNTLSTEQDGLINERAELQVKLIEARNASYSPVLPTAEPAAPEQRAVTGRARYNTTEYRQAFQNFIATGEVAPILRADASTGLTDVQSVIVPTVITERLFLRRTNAGSIFDRVMKANYAPGMTIKTTAFFPELSWVAEGATSDRLKAASGQIVFNGYKGQIQFAISLEASTMSLEAFETAIVDRILKGCRLSFDKSIVAGTGVGQPTGIMTGADYTKAHLMDNISVSDHSEWIKAFSKVPLAEQPYVNLMINKSDWQAYFFGMKDANGRTVAYDQVGIGGAVTSIFNGREVVVVENQGLPTFDSITGNATASKSTAFAAFVDFDMYVFNSNLTLNLRQYIDENTDEIVRKATIIADGKMIDKSGLIPICRNVDAAETPEV